MSRSRLTTFLAAILLLLAVAACKDDGPSCPSDTITPTMANLWPHADGSQWTYDLVQTAHADTTATLVPPGETILPTMAQLYADLSRPLQAATLDTFKANYSITLDGTVVTLSGVTAQRMIATLVRDDGTPVAGLAGGEMLLAVLAQARPDLREVLPRRAVPAAGGFGQVSSPLMLGGYAFAYEDSGYFGYGDISTQHSWIYLAGSVSIGTGFELQLVPQLADDVWLRGQVRTYRAVTVGGRLHCNAVEVQYVVDLGESLVSDETGHQSGAYRSYVAGLIVYLPGVGPVYCHERMRSHTRTAYEPSSEKFLEIDQVLFLAGTG